MTRSGLEKRSLWMSILVGLNLPVSLFAALVLWQQFAGEISTWFLGTSQPFHWFEPLEKWWSTSFEKFWLSLPVPLFSLLLYLLGYMFSFHSILKKRPWRRLWVLHLEFSLLLAMTVVHGLTLELEGWVWGLWGAMVLAFPPAMLGLEHALAALLKKMAAQLENQAQYKSADRCLTLALRLKPGDQKRVQALGLSRFDLEEYEGAVQLLGPFMEEEEVSDSVLEALEVSLRNLAQWKQNWRVQQRLLARHPENLELRLGAARTLQNMGQMKKGLELLEQAPEPKMASLLDRALQYALEMEDMKAALRCIANMEKLPNRSDNALRQAYREVLKRDSENRAALEGLGEILIRQNLQEEGYAFLERVVRQDYHRYDLRTRLVQFYQESSQAAAMEPHLSALIDAGKANREIVLLYGSLLMEREEYDTALMHFEDGAERWPQDYRFPFFLARIALHNASLEEAMRWAEEALDLTQGQADRKRVQGLMQKIEKAWAGRDFELLEQRARHNPEDMDAQLEWLLSLCYHGQFDQAMDEYAIFLKKKPQMRERVIADLEAFLADRETNFRILDFLADLRLEAGEYDAVFALAEDMAAHSLDGDAVQIQYCERILQKKPDHQAALQRLTGLMVNAQEWERVLELYDQQIEMGIQFSRNDVDMQMHAALRTANPDLARELADALIENFPEDLSLRMDLLRFFANHECYDDALELGRQAREHFAENTELAGLVRETTRRWERHRLDELESLMAAEPDNMEYCLEAADLFARREQVKRAISLYQKATRDPEQKNKALCKMALAMARLRMLDLAEENLDEMNWEEILPEEEELFKTLTYDAAAFFQKAGDHLRALKYFKLLFRRDAAFRDVVDRIEALSE